jgi:hypothetical protein
MEDRQAGGLEAFGVLPGIAGTGRHELHALLDDEIDDRWVADKRLGDVDCERQTRSKLSHGEDFATHVVELA